MRVFLLVFFASFVLVACGDTGTGVGFFDPGGLSGSYRIDDGCVATVQGSAGSLDCDRVDSGDTWTVSDSYVLDAFQLLETRLTARITNHYTYRDTDQPDWNYDYTGTAYVQATRSQGRSTDGRFAAIAGTWSGTAEWTESDADYFTDPPTRAADGGVIPFDAEIYGNTIDVTWIDDRNRTRRFTVTSTPDGLDVDGEFVREL